jgi:hypothetical protein
VIKKEEYEERSGWNSSEEGEQNKSPFPPVVILLFPCQVEIFVKCHRSKKIKVK